MIALLAAITLSTQAIDAARSTASFSVTHIYVERVAGTVPIASGSVTFDTKTLLPSAVSATMDATKLHTDEPDRDAALQGTDWFDIKRFPTWTFTSTSVQATGPSTCTIAGLLTMHGVTQPEQLDVTIAGTPEQPEYRAVARIDRRAFGMRTTRLDPVIGNPVDVTLDVVVK